MSQYCNTVTAIRIAALSFCQKYPLVRKRRVLYPKDLKVSDTLRIAGRKQRKNGCRNEELLSVARAARHPHFLRVRGGELHVGPKERRAHLDSDSWLPAVRIHVSWPRVRRGPFGSRSSYSSSISQLASCTNVSPLPPPPCLSL